jgi:hypothetical protein
LFVLLLKSLQEQYPLRSRHKSGCVKAAVSWNVRHLTLLVIIGISQDLLLILHTGILFFSLAVQPSAAPPFHTRFLDLTQRRATVGRTPLDE